MHNAVIYVLIMALVTYLVRVLPLTLIRREIKNPIIRSFLFYVPYVTLAVMTFPAILSATGSVISGAAAFAVGILLAWFGLPLLPVSVLSCVVVFVLEGIISIIHYLKSYPLPAEYTGPIPTVHRPPSG